MAKLNSNLYGGDPTGTADSISSRILGNPDPTLDIHGEKDSRFTKGNMDEAGRNGQSGSPSSTGKTGA